MNVTTFEVKVLVKTGTRYYSSFLGMYVREEIIKMFHQDARTGNQAMQKCEKYGRPISAHKADAARMLGNIEGLHLEQGEPPQSLALAMDEMIWRKRNIRIKNQQRDKENVDIP